MTGFPGDGVHVDAEVLLGLDIVNGVRRLDIKGAGLVGRKLHHGE
jgi:hypothetical protein